MPPQQPDRLLDLFNEAFRTSARMYFSDLRAQGPLRVDVARDVAAGRRKAAIGLGLFLKACFWRQTMLIEPPVSWTHDYRLRLAPCPVGMRPSSSATPMML